MRWVHEMTYLLQHLLDWSLVNPESRGWVLGVAMPASMLAVILFFMHMQDLAGRQK